MDVWLLFGLTLPFISFVLSILEELLQDSEQQDEAKAFHLLRNLSNIRIFFYPGLDTSNGSKESRMQSSIFYSGERCDGEDVKAENHPNIRENYLALHNSSFCACLYSCSCLPVQPPITQISIKEKKIQEQITHVFC